MFQVYKDTASCCGCTACKNVCPKSAITMQEDEKGFLYPVIDSSLCVDCSRCAAVCPFENTEQSLKTNEQKIFAVVHPDKRVVSESSSGGAFTLISDIVLKQGGTVYGCIIDENFNVIHTCAASPAERDAMRGSKYVQSNLRNTFEKIKRDLETRPVLFVGTPCQVAGLNLYLGKEYDNLTTVDFICHGTPSSKLLRDHIAFLEKKYNKKAKSYKFRDKIYGWRHIETVFWDDGTSKTSYLTLRLKKLFMINASLRDSCFNCKFTCQNRPSDITIADFWGAEKVLEIYDNTGISIMMLNSPKARALFKSLPINSILKEVSFGDIIQQALIKAPTCHEKAVNFWEEYFKYGYEYVAMKYAETKRRHYLRFIPVSIITNLKLDKFFNMAKTKIRKLRG